MGALTGFEGIMRTGEPLAMHTWFQLGGPAEYFAEPETRDELSALVRRCHEEDLPVRLLGEGSNILVRDEGCAALVVRLSAPRVLPHRHRRPPHYRWWRRAVGPRRHRRRPPWPGGPGNADRHSRHRRRGPPRKRRQPLGQHRAMDAPRHGPQGDRRTVATQQRRIGIRLSAEPDSRSW